MKGGGCRRRGDEEYTIVLLSRLLTCCGGVHYHTCEDNEIRLRLKLLDCVCDQL